MQLLSRLLPKRNKNKNEKKDDKGKGKRKIPELNEFLASRDYAGAISILSVSAAQRSAAHNHQHLINYIQRCSSQTQMRVRQTFPSGSPIALSTRGITNSPLMLEFRFSAALRLVL